MTEHNIVLKINRWKTMSKRTTRRPQTRWEMTFERYKEYECKQLENFAQNIDGRK
jgi:hypothetical protein